MTVQQDVQHYNQLYLKGSSEIPDVAYDALERKAGLPATFQDVSGLENKNEHAFPMLSLEKAYIEKEIENFYSRAGQTSFVLEPKIDGLGVSCRYNKGVFQKATTRGNGYMGEDITSLLQEIIPHQINNNEGICEIRGELFIDKNSLNKIEKNYKTCRNAIAGMVNSREVQLIKKYARVVFFHILTDTPSLSTAESLNWLNKNGFQTPSFEQKDFLTGKDLYFYSVGFYNKYLYFNFLPIDGIVIKVNEAQTKQTLGTTSSALKWAIALKNNDGGKETIVERIVYQIGRTGVITPVAEIQPIILRGTQIRRVTLHNLKFLESLDIRPKDTVLVTKAGQVIPQIIQIYTEKRALDSTPINIGQSLEAANIQAQFIKNQWVSTNGEALRIQQLIYYAKTLRIAKLGPCLIRQLVADGTVKDAMDLYHLNTEMLCQYVNIGPQTANKVVQNIQATRHCRFQNWLVACGIPKIGPQTAEVLASNICNFYDFLSLDENKLETQIGPNLAQSFSVWFHANRSFVEQFQLFPFQFNSLNVQTTIRPLLGSTFVFTGKLDTFSREQATHRITVLGGQVQRQINKKTHYLVQGKAPSKSKVEKAQLLMCKLLGEEEFINLLNKYKEV